MYAVIEMKLNHTTPNLNPAFDLDKLIGLYKENQLNRRCRWQNGFYSSLHTAKNGVGDVARQELLAKRRLLKGCFVAILTIAPLFRIISHKR